VTTTTTTSQPRCDSRPGDPASLCPQDPPSCHSPSSTSVEPKQPASVARQARPPPASLNAPEPTDLRGEHRDCVTGDAALSPQGAVLAALLVWAPTGSHASVAPIGVKQPRAGRPVARGARRPRMGNGPALGVPAEPCNRRAAQPRVARPWRSHSSLHPPPCGRVLGHGGDRQASAGRRASVDTAGRHHRRRPRCSRYRLRTPS